MKAGADVSEYSVSPFETEDQNGVKDGNGVVEVDSEGEDLRMEAGEICGRVRLEEEGAVIKKLIDPKLPSQEAVDRHWIRGHVEYRNWCEVCVRARGKEWDHTKMADKERVLPEHSWAYCFPGDEMGYKWTFFGGGRGERKIGRQRLFRPKGAWGGMR